MTINIEKLGWPVATLLAGIMLTGALSGFQGNTAPKFASVNIAKVFDESSLAATNTDTLETARKLRASILEFINANRAMDSKDAERYSVLAVKGATVTPAEKAELDKLKASAEEATRKQRELSTKTTLTDADRAAISDFGAKVQANNAFLGQLQQRYQDELQNMNGDLRDKTLDRVREVVQKIAAAKGYTVVFSDNAAPYAANDITDEALKALKK